jgi:imidazolonepropionase-like amidohydrolase
MTAAGTTYDRADVLIQGAKISQVGVDLKVPSGTREIDVRGKVVTPGVIDSHSHIGVYGAPGLSAHSDGNEAVAPVTAYARAADAYWPQDPQIDAARAGGVTTMHILPGSANLIGGRGVTVRTVPGARSIDDVRFPGAPESLKMACGENPKRVYGEKGGPSTRMGNVAGYRRAFQSAVEYRRSLDRYRQELADWEAKKSAPKSADAKKSDREESGKDSPPNPPTVDFGLETLALVLDGKILVQNHCYRADEMSLMLGLARDFGFKIRSFHHAVEAYKIADRLAAAGTAASVWADWWGFKAEAYDAVPENAAMLQVAGARPVIHSDSALGIQRLNQEAAKAYYAGLRAGFPIQENDALRWFTANPAWALGIDDVTGTLESGKLADIVVWNTSPFSVYAQAQMVWLGGKLVYDHKNPSYQPRTDFTIGLKAGDIGGNTP